MLTYVIGTGVGGDGGCWIIVDLVFGTNSGIHSGEKALYISVLKKGTKKYENR